MQKFVAAVAVLHDLEKNTLILTRRNETLRLHPGEICFPGGGVERKDKTRYRTALRELNEELGIEAQRVKLTRAMQLEQTLTGIIIYPWYMRIASLNPYKKNKEEVAEVITLPFDEVREAQNYQELMVPYEGNFIKNIRYTKSAHLIWGATARIMHQLTSSTYF